MAYFKMPMLIAKYNVWHLAFSIGILAFHIYVYDQRPQSPKALALQSSDESKILVFYRAIYITTYGKTRTRLCCGLWEKNYGYNSVSQPAFVPQLVASICVSWSEYTSVAQVEAGVYISVSQAHYTTGSNLLSVTGRNMLLCHSLQQSFVSVSRSPCLFTNVLRSPHL